MNLIEHARAIEAAIQNAYADGYELDNGSGEPIREMDLNEVGARVLQDWSSIELPEPTYY
ncbi:hypothetical protein GPA10_22205 [Streptomyces sp. p1417]|uniref:Uncharacterized protein n=1 Tax=Streptomyces typhae TaxID=2681492 RepID=A0A6L6X0V2_9ACTN|nr:hypothetical protein [Streptomyces typhae]MVO87401.1 hypothetical protein [Streptomyces typhae]